MFKKYLLHSFLSWRLFTWNSRFVIYEDIKKRWQEYTEELYKKDYRDQDIQDGVITHLEPDLLECEVKWALESITTNKASGDDGISVELFQILKDDAVKVVHSICQQIWKTQQSPVATGLEKIRFHSNPKERQCQRMLKVLHTIVNKFQKTKMHSEHVL